jgi:hypothetical protein
LDTLLEFKTIDKTSPALTDTVSLVSLQEALGLLVEKSIVQLEAVTIPFLYTLKVVLKAEPGLASAVVEKTAPATFNDPRVQEKGEGLPFNAYGKPLSEETSALFGKSLMRQEP